MWPWHRNKNTRLRRGTSGLSPFFRLKDPVSRLTGYLALWTALLVIVTLGGAFLTDHTLKETLERTNRAWIAPYRITMESPVTLGADVSTTMYYKNVGQSPALKTHWKMEMVRARFDNSDSSSIILPENTTCSSLKGEGSMTIYPGADQPDTLKVLRGEKIDENILQRKQAIVWYGCIKYESYDKPRQSPFCYVFSRAVQTRWVFCMGVV